VNAVFLFIVLAAFAVTGWRQIAFVPPAPDAIGPMDALAQAMVTTAGDAVTLAIGLIGVMTLFPG
jgi:spore maturation protein SpmA